MRILWIKVGGLWPLTSGGRLRSFHLLKELSKRHEIILLTTHTTPDEATELAQQLPHCAYVGSVMHVAPKWNSARFMRLLLRSWFTSWPVDLLKNHVPALQAEVSRILRQEDIDKCVTDFLVAATHVPFDGRVPIVFFAHNVEFMIWKRLCATTTHWWKRLPLALEWRKMRRYETLVCQHADVTVAVSPLDLELFRSTAPLMKGVSIPTGVDTAYFGAHYFPEQPGHLVFSGSMDWHPNEDAVLFFLDRVMPLIRKAVPEASLTVVGRNPGKHLMKQVAHHAIELTGTVDDIRQYVGAAAVFIVPLRIGGGTRLKIFEALAMGKAVVSTSIGAEGLPLVNGVHYLCADEPTTFAHAVIALLNNPARRQQLGNAGRALVEQFFSWQQVAHDFDAKCLTSETINLGAYGGKQRRAIVE